LFEGAWVSGREGDALDEADISAAVVITERDAGPQAGWVYYGGLDLSTSRDRTAFVILGVHAGHTVRTEPEELEPLPGFLGAMQDVGILRSRQPEQEEVYHPGTGRIRLVYSRYWEPAPHCAGKIDLEAVEAAVLEAWAHWRFAILAFDPYELAFLSIKWAKQGMPLLHVAQSGANLQEMAGVLLETFRSRRVELYDDPALLADLRRMKILDRSNFFRIDATRNKSGHVDSGTAWMLAALAQKRHPPVELLQPHRMSRNEMPDDDFEPEPDVPKFADFSPRNRAEGW
jgi:phage terminase large subunit-like protein